MSYNIAMDEQLIPTNEKFAKLDRRAEQDQRTYPYDAVVVLGNSLQQRGERFYPSDYRQSDHFGMLGAGMRIVAAVNLYLNREAKNFVFSTGITEKNKEMFGSTVPPESNVLKEKFLRVLEGLKKRPDYKDRFEGLEESVIVEEDRSVNTASNIREVLQIIKDNGWKNIAIVGNSYHIPRVEALYNNALQQHSELGVEATFVKAEEYVKQNMPNKYDKVIERYFKTEQYKERVKNEQQGLQHFREGRYTLTEFQLK
jgi:uncharacterized SAM-binding protein YcdF (DUF218 family)